METHAQLAYETFCGTTATRTLPLPSKSLRSILHLSYTTNPKENNLVVLGMAISGATLQNDRVLILSEISSDAVTTDWELIFPKNAESKAVPLDSFYGRVEVRRQGARKDIKPLVLDCGMRPIIKVSCELEVPENLQDPIKNLCLVIKNYGGSTHGKAKLLVAQADEHIRTTKVAIPAMGEYRMTIPLTEFKIGEEIQVSLPGVQPVNIPFPKIPKPAKLDIDAIHWLATADDEKWNWTFHIAHSGDALPESVTYQVSMNGGGRILYSRVFAKGQDISESVVIPAPDGIKTGELVTVQVGTYLHKELTVPRKPNFVEAEFVVTVPERFTTVLKVTFRLAYKSSATEGLVSLHQEGHSEPLYSYVGALTPGKLIIAEIPLSLLDDELPILLNLDGRKQLEFSIPKPKPAPAGTCLYMPERFLVYNLIRMGNDTVVPILNLGEEVQANFWLNCISDLSATIIPDAVTLKTGEVTLVRFAGKRYDTGVEVFVRAVIEKAERLIAKVIAPPLSYQMTHEVYDHKGFIRVERVGADMTEAEYLFIRTEPSSNPTGGVHFPVLMSQGMTPQQLIVCGLKPDQTVFVELDGEIIYYFRVGTPAQYQYLKPIG